MCPWVFHLLPPSSGAAGNIGQRATIFTVLINSRHLASHQFYFDLLLPSKDPPTSGSSSPTWGRSLPAEERGARHCQNSFLLLLTHCLLKTRHHCCDIINTEPHIGGQNSHKGSKRSGGACYSTRSLIPAVKSLGQEYWGSNTAWCMPNSCRIYTKSL